MHARIAEEPTTLVWIDSEEAIIVRWDDRAMVERIRSDVPGRHRSAGHVRVDPAVGHARGAPAEAAERARRARLATFVHQVAERLPADGDVMVVGPGIVRERLERDLRADDRRLGRRRHVHAAAAERLSEQELVARVRELAGDAPRRRGLAG
jgi:hypothetical protein